MAIILTSILLWEDCWKNGVTVLLILQTEFQDPRTLLVTGEKLESTHVCLLIGHSCLIIQCNLPFRLPLCLKRFKKIITMLLHMNISDVREKFFSHLIKILLINLL